VLEKELTEFNLYSSKKTFIQHHYLTS